MGNRDRDLSSTRDGAIHALLTPLAAGGPFVIHSFSVGIAIFVPL
jgi:hypothetical protein